jgi:hypothetical protein
MGTGNVTFTVGLSGVSTLSDTGLPYEHFEEFSDAERFLNLV